jgi:hypothetical protein
MGSSRLVGLLVLVGMFLLSASRASAQADRLTRAYLGISSIEARFQPPKADKYCCLAIAKFTEGKFVGYADLTIPVDSFVPGKHYQAELGWARKEGRSGFFMTTEGGLWPSTVFRPDDFFANLNNTYHLAARALPEQKLGPFYVLGYADDGGEAKVVKDPKLKPSDIRLTIQARKHVMLFLMRPFASVEEAAKFAKELPKLSAE